MLPFCNIADSNLYDRIEHLDECRVELESALDNLMAALDKDKNEAVGVATNL